MMRLERWQPFYYMSAAAWLEYRAILDKLPPSLEVTATVRALLERIDILEEQARTCESVVREAAELYGDGCDELLMHIEYDGHPPAPNTPIA